MSAAAEPPPAPLAPSGPSPRRRVIVAVVRMLVVAVVVMLAIIKLDLGEIHDAFHISSWPLLIGAVLANFLSVILKGVAWKAVIQGLPDAVGRVRLRDLLSPLFIGFLFNTLLAARVGELVKVYLARKRLARRDQHFHTTSLLGSVVAENLVSTVTWVGLVVSIGLFLPLPRYAWVASLSLGVACLLVILLAMATRRSASQLPPWLTTGPLWARIARAFTRLWEAVRESHLGLRDTRLMARVSGASLGTWFTQWAGIYLTLHAFGLERVGWGGAGLLLVTITLAQAFPVLPGNLVMFQAAAVVPLTTSYGVGAAEAIAFSVVLQGTEALVGVAIGFLCLLGEGMGFGQLRRDAQRSEAADLAADTRAVGA